MELNPKTINEILDMYVQYCKELKVDIKNTPITFNESEYQTALIDTERIKISSKRLKKLEPLGQTTWKWNGYNDVIFINVEKMKALKGLHEYTDWEDYIKKGRKYIHKGRIRKKIGHLEETLIHELLHVARPELRHGDRFNQIVKNIYLRYNSDNQ